MSEATSFKASRNGIRQLTDVYFQNYRPTNSIHHSVDDWAFVAAL